MKIKAIPKNACVLWHRWELVSDTGFTQYHQCKDCGARFARQPSHGGHQPVDYEWVLGCGADPKVEKER